LDKLIKESGQLSTTDRAAILEHSDFLESAYRNVAMEGDSAVPDDSEEEVDYHYICFTLGSNGHIVRVLHLLIGQPVEVCALAVLSFLSSQALLLSL
jgi:hypothetical protein